MLVLALSGAPAVALPASAAESPTAAEVPATLLVSHPRELRGLWVATVANIDWPDTPGATAERQRAELTELLDLAAGAGLNAVFFQVRAEADAVYASEIEPWSRSLTGVQGQDPGWDPLEVAVDEAHARGLELHAWFNPYRAGQNAHAATASNHVSRTRPDAVVQYGPLSWMDPGNPSVREHVVRVVLDVAERYDVDGIHFDDYFYPYPQEGRSFPDDRSFAAYRAGGGMLDRGAYRTSAVDELVRTTSEALRAAEPGLRFGISPFGIYRPGQPEGVAGFDPVAGLHADPLQWMASGWVDYLAPQLYWPTTSEHQPFAALCEWWGERTTSYPDTTLFVGLYLSQIGRSAAWSHEEFERQVAWARSAPGVTGQLWFSARPLIGDRHGARALLRERIYTTHALPPSVPRLRDTRVVPPHIEVAPEGLVVTTSGDVRAFTLYRLDAVLPPTLERILDGRIRVLPDPGPGLFALAAVGPGDVESLAVMVPKPAASRLIERPVAPFP